MKTLEDLIIETISKLTSEGGAAMKGDRIPQAMIPKIIEDFKAKVLQGLEFRSVKPVGSTGKKKDSGDIDLGLDTDATLEQVANHVKQSGFDFKLNKGLGEVSVLFPFNGLNAQVDLMVGPEAWTQTQYYGPSDTESKYKGVHVRGLVNAIAKVIAGKSVSPARGLFSKDDPDKKYSQDWTSILTTITQKSREPWGPGDLQQPFEKMWEKANRSFSPNDLAEIKKYYLDFMKSTKQTPPSELGEVNKVNTYGKTQTSPGGHGGQVAQGNIGGPRNRGRPGYPVPDVLRTNTHSGRPEDMVGEAVEPADLPKGIKHLDDLKPEEFMAFLKKYAEMPIAGGIEISEKVDGSARITFGPGSGHIWTQSKNGTRKATSNQYPETEMYVPLKNAHKALESKAQAILAKWPEGVAFMVAEVLYSRIPNTIEYGPNVIMIHGVHTTDGNPVDDAASSKMAKQVINATGGQLSDGEGTWKFEYKRTIKPEDVMVDVKSEYETLGQLAQSLEKTPRDKNLKAKFQSIQKQVKVKLLGQLRKQKSAYGPEGGDVEGLVFRDLDNGTMVKLVDKDYFTKLNNFLWQWRKMLDAGVKDDAGQWQVGLMQQFRDLVAKDVLGDKTASSTTFVKKLVQSAAGEQNADKVLAKYIRDNNLMSGDFHTSFQRTLMGAFKQLEQLKAKWEKYKTSDPQFKFNDPETGTEKSRAFPPEIVTRSENAFNQAEAILQGIRAGMEQANTIQDPLTKKVALLKLMMGHRFEKLQSRLGDQDIEDLDEASMWGPQTTMPDPNVTQRERDSGSGAFPPVYPDPSQNHDDHHGFFRAIQQYQDKLLKRGIDITGAKIVGSGAYGTAMKLRSGKVLKVTDDREEAKTSNHIKGKQLKYVCNIFDVFKFPTPPDYDQLYGIVLEFVTVIPRSEAMTISSNIWEFQGVISRDVWMDPAYDKDYLTGAFLQKADRTGPTDPHDIVASLEHYNILDMRDELINNEILFNDFHGGNMGKRGTGNYVVFDLGADSMSPGAEPPVLEGGPIDRMTGPTDLSGAPRIDGQVEVPHTNLDEAVYRQIRRLLEATGNSHVGATIGRYQPFHAGHAAVIRELARKFSRVLVFVAGNSDKDKQKDPFSYDLRLEMMKRSLPDVWSKLEVYPATIQGKNSGYVPGLVANAANIGGELGQEAVQVLVGEDRLMTVRKQVEHNNKHIGEPGYFTGAMEVVALPGVKNDDDTSRISGTRVREAIAKGDKATVRRMLDPRLSTDNSVFEEIFKRMSEEMKGKTLATVENVIETVITELGMGGLETGAGWTKGGAWGSSAWSRGAVAGQDDGDELYQQMLRSPSTRMLPMAHHGQPNADLPGFNNLTQDYDEKSQDDEPTDLGETVENKLADIFEATRKKAAATPKKVAAPKPPKKTAQEKEAERKRISQEKAAAKLAARQTLIDKQAQFVPWSKTSHGVIWNNIPWTAAAAKKMDAADIATQSKAKQEFDPTSVHMRPRVGTDTRKINSTIQEPEKKEKDVKWDEVPNYKDPNEFEFDKQPKTGNLFANTVSNEGLSEAKDGESAAATEGNGEYKFAWEMCKNAHIEWPGCAKVKAPTGQGDIVVAGKYYEVKEISKSGKMPTYKSSSIRIMADSVGYAKQFKSDLKEAWSIIGPIWNALKDSDDPKLEQLKSIVGSFVNDLPSNHFSYTNYQLLEKSTFHASQLKSVVKICMVIKKVLDKNSSIANKVLVQPHYGRGKPRPLLHYLAVNELSLPPWIEDPKSVLVDWRAVQNGIHSLIPQSVTDLVLVNEKEGYFITESKNISKFFRIQTITPMMIGLAPATGNEEADDELPGGLEIGLDAAAAGTDPQTGA